MYRRRNATVPSAQDRERLDAAYRRHSAWLSGICAWASAALGFFALYVLVAGYRDSFGLSGAPRPNVGPGFSEGFTAAIGALWVGAWISLVGVLVALVALLHSRQRGRTALFALPAVVCLLVVIIQPRWLFSALRYGL